MTSRKTKASRSKNPRMAKLARIEALVHDVSQLDSPLHMALWGRVKSGKTGFIASGPDPIIFAVEEGTKTIRNTPAAVFPTELVEGTVRWRTPKWKDARDFIYYLRHGNHAHKTVGVDTMTSLARTAVRFINRDEEVRDEARAPGTMDQRTYGRLATVMNEFMEDLEAVCKERNMHLIYTCQERVLNEEQAMKAGSDFVPDLTPAVRATFMEKPDIIARTVIEEVETEDLDPRNLQLRYGMVFRHEEWPVGERVTPIGEKPYLPAIAYNVTVPKLIRRIERKKKEK